MPHLREVWKCSESFAPNLQKWLNPHHLTTKRKHLKSVDTKLFNGFFVWLGLSWDWFQRSLRFFLQGDGVGLLRISLVEAWGVFYSWPWDLQVWQAQWEGSGGQFCTQTVSGQIIATSHDLGPQKVAFRKGHPLISGKIRLVKYYNLARNSWSGKPGKIPWICLRIRLHGIHHRFVKTIWGRRCEKPCFQAWVPKQIQATCDLQSKCGDFLLVFWNLKFTKIGCNFVFKTMLTAYPFDAKVLKYHVKQQNKNKMHSHEMVWERFKGEDMKIVQLKIKIWHLCQMQSIPINMDDGIVHELGMCFFVIFDLFKVIFYFVPW